MIKYPLTDPGLPVFHREQGGHHLIASYLNDPCRHHIDVSSYPDDVEVPSFQRRAKCGKCGAHGRRIDVRPNWKVRPLHVTTTKNWKGPASPARPFIYPGHSMSRGSLNP